MKNYNIRSILPGLVLCISIAYMSIYLSHFIPSIGSASIAIFLGIFFRNIVFKSTNLFSEGSNFAESNILSYSIVLLGGTVSISTIFEIGFSGVSFITLQMIVTILAAVFIGKALKFPENFRLLMASGNAVCGSSAIASTAPTIGASEQEKGISITLVNLTGTVLMLILPSLSKVLYSNETLHTSALIGGILQSVGQVVASGGMVNESVKDLATIFKIVRVIFLVFVVLSFSLFKNKSSKDTYNKKTKVKMPWYVIGFFIMCTAFTLKLISNDTSTLIKNISSKLEIIALAGIGMRVHLKSLIENGIKTSIYASLIASVQIFSALILIDLLL